MMDNQALVKRRRLIATFAQKAIKIQLLCVSTKLDALTKAAEGVVPINTKYSNCASRVTQIEANYSSCICCVTRKMCDIHHLTPSVLHVYWSCDPQVFYIGHVSRKCALQRI